LLVLISFSPFLQAMNALRESRGIALLCFQTSALERGEGSASRSGRFSTPGKDPVPIVQEAGWTQDRSGQVRKISPLLGFDPQTVLAVASRYND
jgi:hypothetical protein